jgi:hypothetical protein
LRKSDRRSSELYGMNEYLMIAHDVGRRSAGGRKEKYPYGKQVRKSLNAEGKEQMTKPEIEKATRASSTTEMTAAMASAGLFLTLTGTTREAEAIPTPKTPKPEGARKRTRP